MDIFSSQQFKILTFGLVFFGSIIGIVFIGPNVAKIFPPKPSLETTTIEMDISGFENDASHHFLNIEANRPELLTTFPSQYLESNAVLTQADTMVIHNGKIADLPYNIDSFKNLTVLKIFPNTLTTLPPTIGNLSKLKTLSIINNLLVQIPNQIGNLSILRTLVLNDNAIDSLPQTIGNLTQLTVLDLRNNKLTMIPLEVSNLHSLQVLYLGGNPLSIEQKEILTKILPNTKIYF